MHPEIPNEGMTIQDLFVGRRIDVPSVQKQLNNAAEQCGLPFNMGDMVYNSRAAQELGKWAESVGRGEDFHNAVFRAYFVDRLNIAEAPVLIKIVESLGLNPAVAEETLTDGAFKIEVDEDWAHSMESSIMGVPAFNAAGRIVVGAQPYEVLERLVKVAGAQRKDHL